jgi:hypothetical protein
MIIFVNDDRAYLSWVTHHRQGFVLDGKRRPKIGHLVVHRATCSGIKGRSLGRAHWTTGGKFKACGSERVELEAWALEETKAPLEYCSVCEAQNEAITSGDGHVHLSKLPSDVLEYILEAALIHLEIEQPPYHLTVADICSCFAKTPGQISRVLNRLLEAGFVVLHGNGNMAAAIRPKRVVLPTAAALRTLAAFQTESDSTIRAELAKLEPE